jgi:hypothetical protein
MKSVFMNFALFQLGWFACVLGGANGLPWIGPIAASAIILYHLSRAAQPGVELKLILLAILLGTLWDSTLVVAGWLYYPSGMLISYLAPYWILAIWALFSTTLNVSLKWMKGRLALASVFGALGGPLAYLAGSRLGGVVLSDPLAALFALSLGWAVMMPVMMYLSERFDGFDQLVHART